MRSKRGKPPARARAGEPHGKRDRAVKQGFLTISKGWGWLISTRFRGAACQIGVTIPVGPAYLVCGGVPNPQSGWIVENGHAARPVST